MSIQFNQSISDSILQTAQVAQKKLLLAAQKLSTGLTLNSSSDGAANMALSQTLNSSSREQNDFISSSKMEQGMIDVASSDLSLISDNNQRIRDLAIQSANGTYGDNERSMMQDEINQLQQENDRIAQSSTFNSKKLLDGSSDGTQVMAAQSNPTTIEQGFKDASSSALGIDSVDISTPENALALVDKIDKAQNTLISRQSELSTASKSLDDNIERNQIAAENTIAANSTIRDTDIAQQMSNLINAKIMMSAAVAMQSQANAMNSSVIGLLRTTEKG